MYALAAISGGLGGCAIASHSILRGATPRVSYVLAYGMIGVVFGMLTYAYGTLAGVDTANIDSLIGASILAGASGSVTLASTNISARWVLKRLGIEVQVTVRRSDEDRRAHEQG
jgi:hypothetical protein